MDEQQAIADWLEMLKVVDPHKYQSIMAELTAQVPGE